MEFESSFWSMCVTSVHNYMTFWSNEIWRGFGWAWHSELCFRPLSLCSFHTGRGPSGRNNFFCGTNINYTNDIQQQPAAVPARARPIGKDKTEVKNTQLVLYNFTVAKKFLFTQEERICRELLRILRVLQSSLLCLRSICPQGPQLSG